MTRQVNENARRAAVRRGCGTLGARHLQASYQVVRCADRGALAGLLESGTVRVVIDQTYPLDCTAAAVAHMLGHHARGKVAITVP